MPNQGIFTFPDGVHFFQRGWLSSNIILLTDKDQAVLIDSGYYTHAQQTLDLVNHQLKGQPLTAIINTHLHSDHCGGNAHLQAAFPNVSTWIPPGHSNFVRNWDPLKLGYIGTGQHCPPFFSNNNLSFDHEFSLGGHTWQCLAAPGHDPHSFILFTPDTGICVTADALWENGFGVVFPEIEGEEGFDDVRSSLDLIESLKPSMIFPGHGAAFTDVSGSLQRARGRLNRFIDNPDAHALYAAKVLIKFKLLELQSIDMKTFRDWAFAATHLEKIHQAHPNKRTFVDWLDFICNDLVRSGAATIDGHYLHNA